MFMARAEQQVAIERETEEKVKSMAEAQEGRYAVG